MTSDAENVVGDPSKVERSSRQQLQERVERLQAELLERVRVRPRGRRPGNARTVAAIERELETVARQIEARRG